MSRVPSSTSTRPVGRSRVKNNGAAGICSGSEVSTMKRLVAVLPCQAAGGGQHVGNNIHQGSNALLCGPVDLDHENVFTGELNFMQHNLAPFGSLGACMEDRYHFASWARGSAM